MSLYSVAFTSQLEDLGENFHEQDVLFYKNPTKIFYSMAPPERDFSIFSGIGARYMTDFRNYYFQDYSLQFLQNSDKLIKEEVVTYSTLDLQFALAYKYFLFKNFLQFQFGSQQFFDSKGFSSRLKEAKNFQTLYIPEMHFVLHFLSVGMALPIASTSTNMKMRSNLYNLYLPIFSISSTLKLYKWPSFINSSFQFHTATSKEDIIYSGSVGIQVDLTYYITLALSYKGLTQSSQKIRENSVVFDFHYRILRDFSGAVSFVQSIYSETHRPYNEFSFKMGYRKSFDLPKKISKNEILEETLSIPELQKVQDALDTLLSTPPK